MIQVKVDVDVLFSVQLCKWQVPLPELKCGPSKCRISLFKQQAGLLFCSLLSPCFVCLFVCLFVFLVICILLLNLTTYFHAHFYSREFCLWFSKSFTCFNHQGICKRDFRDYLFWNMATPQMYEYFHSIYR